MLLYLIPCATLVAFAAIIPYPENSTEWAVLGFILFTSYLCFVQSWRWRRYEELHRKYANRPLESITVVEAQQIMNVSRMWDMPALVYHSLAFALFKTYGIVSGTCRAWPR